MITWRVRLQLLAARFLMPRHEWHSMGPWRRAQWLSLYRNARLCPPKALRDGGGLK